MAAIIGRYCRRSLFYSKSLISKSCMLNRYQSYKFSNIVSNNLRLGDKAPNFNAETTYGKIDFHEFIGDSWCVFFSV